MSETPSTGEQRFVCQSCGNAVEAAAQPQFPCPNCQTTWAPDAGREGTHEAPVGSI